MLDYLATALAYASNRRVLRQRLAQARADLAPLYRERFGKGRFDFSQRRLVGDNGLALVWLPCGSNGAPLRFGTVALTQDGIDWRGSRVEGRQDGSRVEGAAC
jgi:hypothetical protein